MEFIRYPRFPVPRIDGGYVRIYEPGPDTYLGPDTESFRHGARYSEWIANDFSVMRDGGKWILTGITHPRPKGFVSAYEHGPDTHEAEYQLFRAEAEGTFASLMRPGSFTDCEKILWPCQRPDEKPECHAPHLLKRGSTYGVIYGPEVMRLAETDDWKRWSIRRLFSCDMPSARDPFLFEEDGVYRLIYTMGGAIRYRESTDLAHFSEERILQEKLLLLGEPESPVLFRRRGIYYLAWSIYDGRNGSYDERAFVFAGRTLDELRRAAPVTLLRGHAPEFVFEGDDSYILSVFYPENGVSAARLAWDG